MTFSGCGGRLNTHIAGVARACALEGRREEALKILSELKDESKRRYVPAYDIAHVYAAPDPLTTQEMT